MPDYLAASNLEGQREGAKDPLHYMLNSRYDRLLQHEEVCADHFHEAPKVQAQQNEYPWNVSGVRTWTIPQDVFAHRLDNSTDSNHVITVIIIAS